MVQQRRDFSSDLRQVVAMRAFLREVVLPVWDAEADEEALARLELALDEAATNVIRHAYRGEQEKPIEMLVDVVPDRIRVALYHLGEDFDPEAAPPPAFDGSREGGFGLYMIRECVDEVRYFRDERDWRGVLLVKNRPQGERS
jgi:serine/threonine-protein kinase RsbW